MSILTRNPVSGDLPSLHKIWNSAFGNTGMDSFFSVLFKPELCIVAESGGAPAAAGYLVPFGDLRSNRSSVPCAMILSVAALPEHRGFGLGTAVVNALIALAYKSDFPIVVLCPSEDNLFEYYGKRTNLIDFFYINEFVFKASSCDTGSPVPVEISLNEYISRRDILLKYKTYIQHRADIYKYQSLLCKETGGGFYSVGNCICIVERETDNVVHIKELLVPLNSPESNSTLHSDCFIQKTVSSVSQILPADNYVARFPAKTGEGRRFGMLTADGSDFAPDSSSVCFAPWYGVSFD